MAVEIHCLFITRLWGNKIGDAGAEALANALESSKTLVWLRYKLTPKLHFINLSIICFLHLNCCALSW